MKFTPPLIALCVVFLVACITAPSFAEEYPPPTFSIPDTDTTPVEFSVGGIKYRVPRNYLTTMNNWHGGPQNLVTLAVNLPDFKPFSEDTVTCFTEKDILRKEGCDPFTFEIVAPGDVSASKAFARIRDSFHMRTPIKWMHGYEKYVTGTGDARHEYFKKTVDGRMLLFECQSFDSEGGRDGLCEPLGNRADAGPVLHYVFEMRGHLSNIDQIDASLRNLVNSFMIGPTDD